MSNLSIKSNDNFCPLLPPPPPPPPPLKTFVPSNSSAFNLNYNSSQQSNPSDINVNLISHKNEITISKNLSCDIIPSNSVNQFDDSSSNLINNPDETTSPNSTTNQSNPDQNNDSITNKTFSLSSDTTNSPILSTKNVDLHKFNKFPNDGTFLDRLLKEQKKENDKKKRGFSDISKSNHKKVQKGKNKFIGATNDDFDDEDEEKKRRKDEFLMQMQFMEDAGLINEKGIGAGMTK